MQMLAFTLLFAVLSSRIIMWQFLAYMKTVYLIILILREAHIISFIKSFHDKEDIANAILAVGISIKF